jgi:hypothetical protein
MTAQFQPPENIEELVAQYVKLRDRLKEADDAHKKKTKDARDYLDRLNGKLLERLNEIGGDSVKTEAGTAYRTTRRSATIADGEVFREFIITNEAFDIVDWRANASAVEDYIRAEGGPPPGVNFTTAFTVGVRRGS